MHRIDGFSMPRLRVAALAFCALFAFSSISNAQSWIIEETFGGFANDLGFNVVTANDGGSIHIASTQSLGYTVTAPNIHVVRTDPLGAPLWEQVYDMTVAGFEMSIIETNNQEIVFTTGVFVGGSSNVDVLVCRTNALGAPIWAHLIGFNNGANDYSASIIEAANGDLIVSGASDDAAGAGGQDAFIVRLTAAGNYLWGNLYGGNGFDNGRCVRELPNGNLVVAGETSSFGVNNDGYMFSTSGAGVLLWSDNYGGMGYDGFSTVVYGQQNTVYACGVWDDGPNSDIYVVSADAATGNQNVANIYSTLNPGEEGAWFINSSANPGNLVLTGQAGSSTTGDLDVFAMEIGPGLGAPLWFHMYGASSLQDIGRAIEYTPGNPNLGVFTQGGYWILGWTANFGAGGIDEYLIRTNLVGKSGCDYIPPTTNNAVIPWAPNNTLVNNWGNVVVWDLPNNNVNSLMVHCPGQYVPPLMMKQVVRGENPVQIDPATVSARVLPNPVSQGQNMTVEFTTAEAFSGIISVSDIQGREVFRSSNAFAEGVSHLSLDTDAWGSGMYVIRIEAPGHVLSLKAAVID